MTAAVEPRRTRRLARVLRRAAAAVLAGVVALLVLERALGALLPFPEHLIDELAQSRRVYAADGTLLRVLSTDADERVIPVRLHEVSPHLLRALLAAEDERFHRHRGVDLWAACRALAQNLARGRVVSGASTITMQVVRIATPDAPRDVWFKCAQMFRARQLERRLTKAEILEIYCNHVPLGGAIRGFEAASRRWFGVGARDLTLAQAATLVAMLPAPGRRSPRLRPALLTRLRDQLLARLRDAGSVSRAEYLAAVGAPLGARRRSWPLRAPHASEHFLGTDLRRAVRTGLDLPLQERVQELAASPAARPGNGVAVVVLDRRTGGVRAMVGAASYELSQLNAATCRRCVGSTLKPFLYALAIDLGVVGPRGRVLDAPLELDDYQPANFDRGFAGGMDVAEALATSRNLPAVRLLQAVGCEAFAELLRGLGLPVPGALHLDAALGTASASPLELAQAYRRFVACDVGLSGASVRAVLDALSTRPLGAARAGEVAWKTGTSSGRRDAWSVGVTASAVAVVWLGNLSGRGEPDLTGSQAASDLLARVVAAL